MWAVTGWCVITWARVTIALAVITGGTWLAVGNDSSWFWAIAIGAALIETYTVRQLAREWTSEARSSWWWSV